MIHVLLRYSFPNESFGSIAESKVARRKTHPYQPRVTHINTGMKLLTHANYHLSVQRSAGFAADLWFCLL